MNSDEQLEHEYLDVLIRHIQTVQNNCIVLGKILIKSGEDELGRALIQNGLTHDSSKFSGIEWDFMQVYVKGRYTKKESEQLSYAVKQHTTSNPHHPQYWGTIHSMPDVYIAEMVCDWKARATEFGTDLRRWIDDQATTDFKFKQTDEIYTKIMKYVDLVCGKPMEKVKSAEKT